MSLPLISHLSLGLLAAMDVDSKGKGPADATFGKQEVRPSVGRLNMAKFGDLSGGSKSKK